MKIVLLLALLLGSQVTLACDGPNDDDENACQEFWNVEVDEGDDTVAPNVQLIMDEYMNPKESVKNISHHELLRLYRAVKPLAANAFSSSTARFEVMIRYTLWKDKPSQLVMRTNADEPEANMLMKFYRESSNLTEFHPSDGKVWVLFDFEVTPRSGDKGQIGYMAHSLKDFPWRDEGPYFTHAWPG